MTDQTSTLKRMKNFCAVLSHDLNNYSGIIQGYLELLRMELEPGSECHSYVDRLQQACVKLNEKSKTFEVFAETRRLALIPYDPGPLIAEEAERSPRVKFTNDSQGRQIEANPDTFRVAIRELLDNALEASPEQNVEVHSFEDSGSLVVEFLNPCEAMVQTELESIFDPYFSRRGRGRGLGLSRVHGILSRHGASIEAGITPTGWMQFKVTLPLLAS